MQKSAECSKINTKERFRRGGAALGKRINEAYLAAYIELDRITSEKFGVSAGGVTEYINRLNNARFAPGREEALPRLVRYRNLRNKLAHEAGAIRRMNEITKADVKWIRAFIKALTKRKDPISAYLRKARRYAKRRKIYKIVTLCAFILLLLIILTIVLFSVFK